MKLCTNLFTSSLPSFSLPNILRSALAVSRKLGTEFGSQRKLSWIFFSTSCLRCSRDLTAESGLKERIFQTSRSKVLISTRTISLLIQLALRSCMASTILSNFFYSPQLLYSKRSTRFPFQKQPDTQFFLAVFRRMPLPQNTPFLNQPMYRLPFLNSFSPKPLRCELDMYPLSTTLSSNSSSFLCVSGLQPPWVPRKMSVKESPLMSPPFSKPIVSLFPYFCPSMLLAFLISYFNVLVWTLPITKSYSASSNILLSMVKSDQSSLVSITPFRKDAQVSVLEMKLKSLHLPSSWPSLLQQRWAMYPSVRQTQSTILPFTYSAERRQCWEKKILWPCMRSLRQLVMTDNPQSWMRMPLPSFLNDLIPPIYIAFLQWQKQSVLLLALIGECAGLSLLGVVTRLPVDLWVSERFIFNDKINKPIKIIKPSAEANKGGMPKQMRNGVFCVVG